MSGETRVGVGYDTHRLEAGRALILGGVRIPHEFGLVGHSDADVVTHAVIDALLGAAGLGDIGERYPDTDPAYRDADSIALLLDTVGLLHKAGFRPNNVDVTVALERPRLAPHRAAMSDRLAEALGIEHDSVNVKATTGEGIGFVGRAEGAAAMAVATIIALAGGR